MSQAALADCHPVVLDRLLVSDDDFFSTKKDVSRCAVVQAFVVSLFVEMIDERADLTFRINGQIIVFSASLDFSRIPQIT